MALPPLKKPPKRGFSLSRMQLGYLAIAWVALSIIIGVCAFVAIFYAAGGFATATPVPTEIAKGPTATVVAILPTAQPTSTPEPGAPTPIPLVALDTPFMLGGQAIHGGFPAAETMRGAGMTWAKLQAADLTVDFVPAIENAHRLGLRLLISVVDKTDDKYRVTDPAYQQKYADYVVNLARNGADAIEVWNEMNIDREWPSGQISGTSYATFINFVAPQIKAANPNTIVITGAPAPTGYFGGACAPTGCDDKPYIEQMAVAGVFSNADVDCVGIHYNEGIIPPSQTTGDPRGNSEHYTRYYQAMVDTYLQASGDQKPLCFTEIGYLTGEGFTPGLAEAAPGFAWANDTTVAQQAEWLAQAAQLSKQQGHVKLMIVFNIDFTTYGEDPQAAYAVIRPDGSCPACAALSAAMSTP
jgi:hypothetical protein